MRGRRRLEWGGAEVPVRLVSRAAAGGWRRGLHQWPQGWLTRYVYVPERIHTVRTSGEYLPNLHTSIHYFELGISFRDLYVGTS